ncbi:MAG: hypothetical protein Q4E32_00710 [Bacteroidales bacterium]|nr:hypothetical protein [Bacteroidales bacterium]
MTEANKKYRLTSLEEPTDEMLHELMEGVAEAARTSSAKAKAEIQKQFSETAKTIALRRACRNKRITQ